MVREYLSAMDKKELEEREKELRQVERRLTEYESGFLARLDDLLKRRILNEQEFAKANETARNEKAVLESRKAELEELVLKERERTSLAEPMLYFV